MNKYLRRIALMIPYLNRYHEKIKRYRSEIGNLCSEIERLRSEGIKYYSCWDIDNFSLRFRSLLEPVKNITLCCDPYVDNPAIALSETAELSVMNFVKLRTEIMSESIRFSLLGGNDIDEERKFSSGCAKCPKFRLNNWKGEGLIKHIELGMYPAPCQCKCIYCWMTKSLNVPKIDDESAKKYEKVFSIIDWVQINGMTASDMTWDVVGGEITIHPYKDRIFDLIKEQTANFFTNCFIFDERIAENLSANGKSLITYSIDSGTPETWFKVKGVNNFEKVIGNLEKYIASGVRPEQIQLKYLVLPGINDNLEDYRTIIHIAKEKLKVRSMEISVDTNTQYRESVIRPVGFLLAMLRKNDFTTSFSPHILHNEIERTTTFADELLETGEV